MAKKLRELIEEAEAFISEYDQALRKGGTGDKSRLLSLLSYMNRWLHPSDRNSALCAGDADRIRCLCSVGRDVYSGAPGTHTGAARSLYRALLSSGKRCAENVYSD